MISHSPSDPVDGQAAVRDGGDVVVFQEDDSVGVLDHGAVAERGRTRVFVPHRDVSQKNRMTVTSTVRNLGRF